MARRDRQLSPHFHSSEFRDKRTGALVGPDQKLVDLLEAIRELSGEPLHLVSAYRTTETNRLVGGAKRSQHLYGRAADIPPGRLTLDRALDLGATGVGVSGDWAVHVDVRPGPPQHWTY